MGESRRPSLESSSLPDLLVVLLERPWLKIAFSFLFFKVVVVLFKQLRVLETFLADFGT